MNEQTCAPLKRPILKLLVSIVDWDQVNKLEVALKECHGRFSHIYNGMGTASSEIMDVLGLGCIEKAIAICFLPNFLASDAMEKMKTTFKLDRPGKGIAFTIPLSGVYAGLSQMVHEEFKDLQERLESQMEKDVHKLQHEIENDLIVAAVNLGFSDAVMDAARAAGAFGGTVVLARKVEQEETKHFFGISIQEEREVVAILVNRNKKREIMQAISSACGLKSPAQGMVFALPVDAIAGLDLNK